MPEEQIAVRKLRPMIDTMFEVFEQANILLSDWKPHYHHYFIELMWKLKQVEVDFYALGYDEEYVLTIKQAVYSFVFGDGTSFTRKDVEPFPEKACFTLPPMI